jgi:hypothetical protein
VTAFALLTAQGVTLAAIVALALVGWRAFRGVSRSLDGMARGNPHAEHLSPQPLMRNVEN